MSSSRSSRPGTSGTGSSATQGGHDEAQSHVLAPKPEINLNRDLPPLPSLDTWEREKENEKAKGDAHIATVMRLQDHSASSPCQQQQNGHPPRISSMRGSYHQHKRSGSDSLAMAMNNVHPTISPAAAAARSGSLRARHQSSLPVRNRHEPPQSGQREQPQPWSEGSMPNGASEEYIEQHPENPVSVNVPVNSADEANRSTSISDSIKVSNTSTSHSVSNSTSNSASDSSPSSSLREHSHSHDNPSAISDLCYQKHMKEMKEQQQQVPEPPNFSRKISTDMPRLSSSASTRRRNNHNASEQEKERHFDTTTGPNHNSNGAVADGHANGFGPQSHNPGNGNRNRNGERDRGRSRSEGGNVDGAGLVPGAEAESNVLRAGSAVEGEKGIGMGIKGEKKGRLRKALSLWVLRRDKGGKERHKGGEAVRVEGVKT